MVYGRNHRWLGFWLLTHTLCVLTYIYIQTRINKGVQYICIEALEMGVGVGGGRVGEGGVGCSENT